MLKFIFAIVCLALLAFLVTAFWLRYGTRGGITIWEKILDAFHWSHTILWTRLIMLLASLVGFFPTVADLLNAPGVGDAFKAIFGGSAQTQAIVMFVVAAGAEIARRMPGSSDPIK